jgi:NAD(P)-dependent dehydrogenase (short-subunit alcohol dehydrogenase family)
MDLSGKVAHVTGAAAGIGRAIAVRFADEGASVAVSDIDEIGGRETVEVIEAAGGRAAFVRADASREEDVESMLAFTEDAFGRLDILVNNAGGAPEPYFPEAVTEHWSRTIEVNLLGVMLGTYHGIAALRRRGGGAIVNVSSRAGLGFRPYESPEYGAAKAAVWRLTAALGSLAAEAIRVTCICPDWVETESVRAARETIGEKEWLRTAPATLVPPEAIAEVAVLLVGDDRLAGRVVHCPHDAEWGMFALDQAPRLEPLSGVRYRGASATSSPPSRS